eukprot:136198-Rhodomonas_salina.3
MFVHSGCAGTKSGVLVPGSVEAVECDGAHPNTRALDPHASTGVGAYGGPTPTLLSDPARLPIAYALATRSPVLT